MRTTRTVAGMALAIAVTACSVTQREKPELAGGHCALIPPNICSQLTPGPAGGPGLRYIAPNVQWTQYTKVIVSPVTGWGGEVQKLSTIDAQALTDYLYNALVNAFSARFKIVDKPAPDVLQIQAAITDATAATPALRTVSMAVPQARVLATLKYAATGTYPFVGTAQGELEFRDAVSGRVLAAAVDRRVGGGSIETAAQWQWGDAQNAMDAWAQLAVTRLVKLQSGQ